MIRLLLPLLLFPVLEIYLLVELAQLTSGWEVLAYLLLTALAGGRLIARPGALAAISSRHYRFGTGSPVRDRMLEIAAGLLLILPGLLSDLLALTLMVPPLRQRLLRWAARALPVGVRSRASVFQASSSARRPPVTAADDPIDVPSRSLPE
ncbi:MAG TPA: FxsA family protein [Pirellulales bacterium]